MKKILMGLFVSIVLMCSFSVNANSNSNKQWAKEDWKIREEYVRTFVVVRDSESRHLYNRYFIARVNHSESGHQRIYFEVYISGSYKVCEPEAIVFGVQTQVWKINGRSVNMNYWCVRGEGDNNNFYYVTPSTEVGFNYVVNEFKRAPDYVWVSNGRFNVPISAKGFTRVWNNAGGDAL